MRHHKISRKFNRTSSHRNSMFRNMTDSLIKYERIKTTLTKAKTLRKIVEPLITIAKKDSLHNRRLIFSRIRNNSTVLKLFKELGPRFLNRTGGYTRILKFGFYSDCKAYIEFVSESNITDKKV